MTVEEAIVRADEMRPGNKISVETKQKWLREMDGRLRAQIVNRSETTDFDAVGADVAEWDNGLWDDAVLLVPAPYDALYPHALCARLDLALGETDRYMNAAEQCNGLETEWAAEMRQRYMPKKKTVWKW